MEQGYPAEVIADILNVGRSTVFDWQQKYRAGGLATLSTTFASGRPTTLSDRQMMRLYSMIEVSDPRIEAPTDAIRVPAKSCDAGDG